MTRLSLFFVLLFLLTSARSFGQTSTGPFVQQNPWQRIHADQLNSGEGFADGSNGFGQWQYKATGAIDSSPAIDVNWNIYFGTNDGYLISLNERGTLRWKFYAGAQVYSPAIGPDGNIYVGCANGNMYSVSSSGGTVNWQFKAKGPIRTTPVFDKNQNVVFGSDDHNVYSVGITSGMLVASSTSTSTVSLSPACAIGSTQSYFVSDDGHLFSFDSAGGGIIVVASDAAGFTTSPVFDSNGGIIVGSADSYIYDYEGNTLQWSYKAASAITSTPAVGPDGTIYFGTQAGVFYAYNHAQPTNPLVNWVCIQPGGPIYSSPALGDGGVVYFGCDDGHLYATQSPGNVTWQVNVAGSKIRSSPAITFDGTIMVGAENSTFYAIGSQSPVAVASIAVNPDTVVGGNTTVGTVTLTQSAPAGGDIVNLRVQNEPVGNPPSLPPTCSSVPAIVQVPQFQSSVQFLINTILPEFDTFVDLYATSGFTILKTTFVVEEAPLVSWQVTPTSIIGGNSVTGTATISEPAGIYGEEVIISGGIDIAPKPFPIIIPSGNVVAYVAIAPGGVDSTVTEPVTATAGGVSITAELTIYPADLASITVLPTQVVGGVANSIGSINLNGLPGRSGSLVSLTSSKPNVASVPSSFLVYIDPVLGLINQFPITSYAVPTNVDVTISGTFKLITKSADLLVTPPQLTSFIFTPNSVLGGQTSTGTVNLSSVTPSGGITVQLASQNADLQMPSSILVPQGSASASFTASTNGVPSSETTSATASWDGVTLTATVKLLPPVVQSISVGPSVVVGGSNVVIKGTVTLSGPSNPVSGNGDIVNLSSSDTTVVTIAPSVTVANGSSSAAFTMTTLPVLSTRNVTVTATFNNSSQTATITVNPVQISGIALTPAIVGGGSPSLGQVAVTSTAGPAGYVVNLSTDNADASTPATVKIPAGASVAPFPITTKAVTKQVDVRVTGAYSTSSNTAILTLIPTVLGTLTISPTSLVGGNSATGTVQLNGAALSPGLKVSLSSNSGDATVPGSVTIPTGSTATTFAIKTKGVSTTVVAIITAKLAKNTATAKLTILPAPLESLTLSTGSVIGGSSTVVTGTVTLSGFGSNTVVTLSSSNASAASVPASVKVASGKASATFTVTHFVVSSSTTVTITASAGGVTKTATLTVNPLQVVSLTLTPTSVVGGKTSNGVVALNAPVGSKAVVVSLKSSSSSAKVPATVSVGSKQTTGKFTVSTVKVPSNTSTTITATLGSSSTSASLAISSTNQPLQSLSLSTGTVVGDSSTVVTGTVTLAGVASSTVVSLMSSDTSAATVPASVAVASGKASATFTVTTLLVSASKTVTITATSGGVVKTATLTVNPFQVISLVLTPTSVVGGQTSSGVLTLNAPVGSKAVVVSLKSSSSSATVPATVSVGSKQTVGKFTVKTGKVTATTSATITGLLGTNSAAAGLTIQK